MAKKTKILIVDEDMTSLSKMYLGILQRNYDVEASINIDEIIQRMERFEPEVLIVSQELFSANTRIFTIIRKRFQLPVIITTNRDRPYSPSDFDVQGIIEKPINT